MEGVKIIGHGDFSKLDIRVAEIKEVEEIEGADKLYKLTVDIGDEERTVCAGIKPNYSKNELMGKKIIVLTNLESRTLRGVESRGMLLAASSLDEKKVVLLTVDSDIGVGSRVS